MFGPYRARNDDTRLDATTVIQKFFAMRQSRGFVLSREFIVLQRNGLRHAFSHGMCWCAARIVMLGEE